MATSLKKRKFVIKAMWRSTAKLLKIYARNEDEAMAKAEKRKDIKGVWQLKLMDS